MGASTSTAAGSSRPTPQEEEAWARLGVDAGKRICPAWDEAVSRLCNTPQATMAVEEVARLLMLDGAEGPEAALLCRRLLQFLADMTDTGARSHGKDVALSRAEFSLLCCITARGRAFELAELVYAALGGSRESPLSQRVVEKALQLLSAAVLVKDRRLQSQQHQQGDPSRGISATHSLLADFLLGACFGDRHQGDNGAAENLDNQVDQSAFTSWLEQDAAAVRILRTAFSPHPHPFQDLLDRSIRTEALTATTTKGVQPDHTSLATLDGASRLFDPTDVYILHPLLPKDTQKHVWRRVYSRSDEGASFSRFRSAALQCQQSLLAIKDEQGHIFGAFASQPWHANPNFYGDGRTFLFSLRPNIRVYRPSQKNTHFQYFNWGKDTLPNGLGLGGQMDHFGLFVTEDFDAGHSKAQPLCSTFNSPRLSGEETFRIVDVEVWAVGDLTATANSGGPSKSVLDQDKEAQAVLELAGRKMHSKDIREPHEEDED